MFVLATSSNDWSKMTPEQWMQAVGTMLLFLMVWLIKRLVANQDASLKDIREQGEKDRALMREECKFVRLDHQQDMQALFNENRENRKSTETGFREISEAIRALSKEVRKP